MSLSDEKRKIIVTLEMEKVSSYKKELSNK